MQNWLKFKQNFYQESWQRVEEQLYLRIRLSGSYWAENMKNMTKGCSLKYMFPKSSQIKNPWKTLA